MNINSKTVVSNEMEKLLDLEEAPQLPKIGEVITGNIIEIGSNITYVDLGPIGTGAIYGYGKGVLGHLSTFKDLKSGDPISASVMDLENEDGFVEMSLKETSMDMIWNELEKKMHDSEIITTRILEANKGGLMIKINGIIGFLPASQLTSEHYPRVSDGDKNKILSLLMQMVNTDVKVKIIGLDRDEGKLIVSEKATKAEEEKAKVSKLEAGDVVEGEISGIVDFGVFVKFKDDLEGLVHISELAWKLIDNPSTLFNVGQKVKCKIIGIDNARISLSIKALEKDPWDEVHNKYKVGQKVLCEVTKINPFGIFAQLDEDIHGLAHISKLNDNETRNIEIGKKYEFEIISIEPADHRLGLKPCFGTPKESDKVKETDSVTTTSTKEAKKVDEKA